MLVVIGAYACYALWDNHQVYQAAEDVWADMLRLKPDAYGENEPSFEELLKINPDVCAWITMDNTKIDYPVLQGDTNLTYINKDVYGDFSLSGSIFLDSRCSKNFDEAYSLIYGHHMANGAMFGDLDLYTEQDFFEQNRIGTLLLPSQAVKLVTLACLMVEASDDVIFDPELWKENNSELMTYIQENALFYDENVSASKLLALSTCSSEFTNARIVLILELIPEEK